MFWIGVLQLVCLRAIERVVKRNHQVDDLVQLTEPFKGEQPLHYLQAILVFQSTQWVCCVIQNNLFLSQSYLGCNNDVVCLFCSCF